MLQYDPVPRFAFPFLLVLSGLLLFAGCTKELQTAEHRHSVRATALVEEIDREERRIKIRVNFQLHTLKVSDEVDAFDQIKVGDRFPLRYRHATTARQLPRDVELEPLDTKLKLSAPKDGRPGNALVQVRRITAEFVDYDYQSRLTTFRRADGSYVYLLATGPFQGFVVGLARGDRVEVVTEEAIAVLLDPTP